MLGGKAGLPLQGLLWELIPVAISGVMRKLVLVTLYTVRRPLSYSPGDISFCNRMETIDIMQVPGVLGDLGEGSSGINSEPRQSNGQDGHRIPGLAKLESDSSLTFGILQVTE